MKEGKLILLKFDNPKATSIDTLVLSTCKVCRNKTFTLTHDLAGEFPLLKCAACGQHMGRMGWAPDIGEEAAI